MKHLTILLSLLLLPFVSACSTEMVETQRLRITTSETLHRAPPVRPIATQHIKTTTAIGRDRDSLKRPEP